MLMRWLWVLGILAGLILIVTLASAKAELLTTQERARLESTAQVFANGGRGSAIYIGNNRWLTSRHIAETGVASVRTATVSFYSVKTEWLCERCDLAVLSTPPQRVRNIPTISYICRPVRIGEEVSYTGSPSNPMSVERLTFFGRIAGIVNDAGNGSRIVVNIWLTMGGSGAGVIDAGGTLIGIVSDTVQRMVHPALPRVPLSMALVSPLTEFCEYEKQRTGQP